MTRSTVRWLTLSFFTTACGGASSPTSPTSTPAEPTTMEVFSGTLSVSGARFYSFPVTVYGHVTVTLESLTGTSDASDPASTVGLGLGLPRGTDCTTSTVSAIGAGTDPQLRNTLDPGIYCVRVSDAGTLTEPVSFTVRIAHP